MHSQATTGSCHHSSLPNAPAQETETRESLSLPTGPPKTLLQGGRKDPVPQNAGVRREQLGRYEEKFLLPQALGQECEDQSGAMNELTL